MMYVRTKGYSLFIISIIIGLVALSIYYGFLPLVSFTTLTFCFIWFLITSIIVTEVKSVEIYKDIIVFHKIFTVSKISADRVIGLELNVKMTRLLFKLSSGAHYSLPFPKSFKNHTQMFILFEQLSKQKITTLFGSYKIDTP